MKKDIIEVLDTSSEGSEGVVISIQLNPDELTLEQKRLAWHNTQEAAQMQPINDDSNDFH